MAGLGVGNELDQDEDQDGDDDGLAEKHHGAWKYMLIGSDLKTTIIELHVYVVYDIFLLYQPCHHYCHFSWFILREEKENLQNNLE